MGRLTLAAIVSISGATAFADELVIKVSGESYEGGASFTVTLGEELIGSATVDPTQLPNEPTDYIFEVDQEVLRLSGDLNIVFTNDHYEGSGRDRNLFIFGATIGTTSLFPADFRISSEGEISEEPVGSNDYIRLYRSGDAAFAAAPEEGWYAVEHPNFWENEARDGAQTTSMAEGDFGRAERTGGGQEPIAGVASAAASEGQQGRAEEARLLPSIQDSSEDQIAGIETSTITPEGVRPHVKLRIPADLTQGALDRTQSVLRRAGLDLGTTSIVGFEIAGSEVRFFHEKDALVATQTAELLGAEARDFSAYSPAPEPGILEVWLSEED